MSKKITLIEYNGGVFAGDDMEPDIQHRDYHRSVSGSNIITEVEQTEVDLTKIEQTIEDMRQYSIAISSSSSMSSSSSSATGEEHLYLRNFENYGQWVQGGTYTFEYFEYYYVEKPGGILTKITYEGSYIWGNQESKDLFYEDDYSVPYLPPNNSVLDPGGGYVWEDDSIGSIASYGIPTELESDGYGKWWRVSITLPEDIPVGRYNIVYVFKKYINSIFDDVFVLQENQTITIEAPE